MHWCDTKATIWLYIFIRNRIKNLANEDIDLYSATIVAVCKLYIWWLSIYIFLLVLETCSDIFQYAIESSFIILYAETTLNMIDNVLNCDQQINYYSLNNPWLVREDEWCQGLLCRPQPKKSLETTAAT